MESTNANENAPFRLDLNGPMAALAKVKCNHQHCTPITPINSFSPTNATNQSFKVSIPKNVLEPTHVATYSIDNVETQNMPILLQTKTSIHNQLSYGTYDYIRLCQFR